MLLIDLAGWPPSLGNPSPIPLAQQRARIPQSPRAQHRENDEIVGIETHFEARGCSGRWVPQTRASALLAFDAAGEIQRASDVEDHAIAHLEADFAQPAPRSLDCKPRGDAAVVHL